MLIEFFLKLKQGGLPVSVREFLTLLEALEKHVIHGSLDDFYYLSRACMVKDESNYDKFDRVFGAYYKGITAGPGGAEAMIPEEWLKKLAEKNLSEEEKKLINGSKMAKAINAIKHGRFSFGMYFCSFLFLLLQP